MMFFGLHGWKGYSGHKYLFRSVLTKHGLPDEGGIYVFVKRRFAFFLEPLYVGKAANLKDRLLGHEKWGNAWWVHGATEHHVMCVGKEADRRVIEEDLIRKWLPKLNDVHIPRGDNDAPNEERLKQVWNWTKKFKNPKAAA